MNAEKWKEIKKLKVPAPIILWNNGTYNVGRNKAKRAKRNVLCGAKQ